MYVCKKITNMHRNSLLCLSLYLLCCACAVVRAHIQTTKGEDGKSRVVVHDEAIIPTHTVTLTTTQTAIQTQTQTAWETRTVQRQIVATPVPQVSTYELKEGEKPHAVKNDTVLIKRIIQDVILRNGTLHWHVTSDAMKTMSYSISVILGVAAMVGLYL